MYNDNIRTSDKPTKLYIIRKILVRAVQNVLFVDFDTLCQKLWAYMSNFVLLYHVHTLTVVRSRDSSYKFLKESI